MNSLWIFVIISIVVFLLIIITLLIYFSLQYSCTSYGDRTSCFETKQTSVANGGNKYHIIVKNKEQIKDTNKEYNIACTLTYDTNARIPMYIFFTKNGMKPNYFKPNKNEGEIVFIFKTTFTDFEFVTYPPIPSLKLSKISVLKEPIGRKAFYKYSKEYNMYAMESYVKSCIKYKEEPRACFYTNITKTSEYLNDSSQVMIEPRFTYDFMYNNKHIIKCVCKFDSKELPQYENIEFSVSATRPSSYTVDRNKGEIRCVFDNIDNGNTPRTFVFIIDPYLPSLKVTSVYFENISSNSDSLLQQDISEEYM